MTSRETSESPSSLPAIAIEAIKVVGTTAGGKEARTELGQSAATITRFINNLLLPVAAVNFAFDKARMYFETRFEDDLASRMRDVPQERILEPKASIAAPVLEGLAFSHDEPPLRDLFLDLLKSAMDSNKASQVHPAFAEVIKQISSEEATLLRAVLGTKRLGVLRLGRSKPGESGGVVVRRYVIACASSEGGEISSVEAEPWIDNWQRLGLVEVDFMRQFTAKDQHYGPIRRRREYSEVKESLAAEGFELGDEEGTIFVTSFGERFGKAIS